MNGVKNVLKNNNVKNIKLNLVYILLDYKKNSKKVSIPKMDDFNSNFSQASKWILSFIGDVNRVKRSFDFEDYSDTIFRAQFAVEKLNKAILILFGLKFKKTYTPSDIINEDLISERIKILDEETKKLLLKITKSTRKFERLGTTPRYGFIRDNELVLPEELYSSKEDIEHLLNEFLIISEDFLILLKGKFSKNETIKLIIKKLSKCVGEYKAWIEKK